MARKKRAEIAKAQAEAEGKNGITNGLGGTKIGENGEEDWSLYNQYRQGLCSVSKVLRGHVLKTGTLCSQLKGGINLAGVNNLSKPIVKSCIRASESDGPKQDDQRSEATSAE